MHTENLLLRLSGDQIVELIRDHRDDLVNKILPEGALKSYLLKVYRMDPISPVKLESMQRALTELALSPVDLSHYSVLILEIRKKDAAVISKSSDSFFYRDIEKAIKNYIL